jgi:uncharacterized membrane protein
LAVGAVAAGAALVEAALLPGLAIGAAAVLAPRLVPRFAPNLRRLVPSLLSARPAPPPAPGVLLLPGPAAPKLPRFAIKRAVAKTITFRVIVTTLDFTTNYLVLGEVATAAGLSAFGLVVGPLFYLAHEASWNYFGTPAERASGNWGPTVDIGGWLPTGGEPRTLIISRALAKTITFRTIATVMDFTTIYVVVGDLGTAILLSATGVVLGPFVYLGHEMAWDRLGPPKQPL